MEDDEETQSPPSGSPAQPRPNGRITVTVAASAPPPNTLTLALPIQQPRNAASSGGGREDCWSEGATAVLIDAWGERYLELSRGNLKQQHWKDVADVVAGREGHTNNKTPKTDVQCKNRIDTVKKKYKTEKAKIAAGGGPSKWRFYDRLDELIGPTAAAMTNQKKIPIGIQLGLRSSSLHNKFQPNHQKHQNQKIQQSRKRAALTESESSDPETSPEESTDSLPPPATLERKRPRRVPRIEEERERNWGKSLRELTKAIVRFGEAYEQAESSKIEQLVELEKQRMKFTKEVELQRMQFFMKTQLEISQLKHNNPPSPRKRRAGNTNNHHSNSNSNINNNINNNSDSSG